MAIASEAIKGAALAEGFEMAGICPAVSPPHLAAYLRWLSEGRHAGMEYMAKSKGLRSDPGFLLEGAKSILAVGLNYYQQPRGGEAKVARYALGRDYHKVLRAKLKRISRWAMKQHPGLVARPCVDSAPILERDYANLAGLGWFGKNTCLIDSKRGSWFFIGLLLLDKEFEPDSPAVGSCGTCRLCIDACPTGALVLGNGGSVAVLDSSRCISYLTIEHRDPFSHEERAMLHGWIFGCDVCQEVCPFNQPREHQPLRAQTTKEPDFEPQRKNERPELVDLLDVSEKKFLETYAGTAFMRAGAERMRRNAQALLQTRNRRL